MNVSKVSGHINIPQVGLLIKYEMTGPGEEHGFDRLCFEIRHDALGP